MSTLVAATETDEASARLPAIALYSAVRANRFIKISLFGCNFYLVVATGMASKRTPLAWVS
ncbi:MAG: hypothetical protein ACI8PT_002014, partial [Gammaproteobacteria bacterium]